MASWNTSLRRGAHVPTHTHTRHTLTSYIRCIMTRCTILWTTDDVAACFSSQCCRIILATTWRQPLSSRGTWRSCRRWAAETSDDDASHFVSICNTLRIYDDRRISAKKNRNKNQKKKKNRPPKTLPTIYLSGRTRTIKRLQLLCSSQDSSHCTTGTAAAGGYNACNEMCSIEIIARVRKILFQRYHHNVKTLVVDISYYTM